MFEKSVDGTKVAIYIADPLRHDDGICTAQLPHSSWNTLNDFITAIMAFDKVDRVVAAGSIMTKSEFNTLISSAEYQLPAPDETESM